MEKRHYILRRATNDKNWYKIFDDGRREKITTDEAIQIMLKSVNAI